jgi:hypothetical protein
MWYARLPLITDKLGGVALEFGKYYLLHHILKRDLRDIRP